APRSPDSDELSRKSASVSATRSTRGPEAGAGLNRSTRRCPRTSRAGRTERNWPRWRRITTGLLAVVRIPLLVAVGVAWGGRYNARPGHWADRLHPVAER